MQNNGGVWGEFMAYTLFPPNISDCPINRNEPSLIFFIFSFYHQAFHLQTMSNYGAPPHVEEAVGLNAENDDGETIGVTQTKGNDPNEKKTVDKKTARKRKKKSVDKQTARKGRHRSMLDKMKMCEEWKEIQSIQHEETKMQREKKFDEE